MPCLAFINETKPQNMKAIRIHQFGGPEVLKLEEAPRPTPAAGEVLIKVHAASVNPVDWKVREGKENDQFGIKLPAILGWDAAGTIEEVGSGVTTFNKGDEVYSMPNFPNDGTYAEYVIAQAGEVAMKPKSLDFTQAAAVPMTSLTAWQGIFDQGHLQPGQRILIHAAAGGVGSFAVQFAKWKGAYVIGTASGANVDFVKNLGADEVIDYKAQKFEDVVKDVDVVLDLIGGEVEKASIKVLKPGGILVTAVGLQHRDELEAKGIRGKEYYAQSKPEDLNRIAALIDEGAVKPVIAKVLPLEKAAEAQTESAGGHVRGKIVLQVR